MRKLPSLQKQSLWSLSRRFHHCSALLTVWISIFPFWLGLRVYIRCPCSTVLFSSRRMKDHLSIKSSEHDKPYQDRIGRIEHGSEIRMLRWMQYLKRGFGYLAEHELCSSWEKKKRHASHMGFPGGSGVKNPPAMQETRIRSLGQAEPLD